MTNSLKRPELPLLSPREGEEREGARFQEEAGQGIVKEASPQPEEEVLVQPPIVSPASSVSPPLVDTVAVGDDRPAAPMIQVVKKAVEKVDLSGIEDAIGSSQNN